MYLGGNGFYWRTAFHDTLPGVSRWPWREPTPGTWEAHPAEMHLSFHRRARRLWRSSGRAPQRLVGVGFASEGFERKFLLSGQRRQTAILRGLTSSRAWTPMSGSANSAPSARRGAGARHRRRAPRHPAHGAGAGELVEQHELVYAVSPEELIWPHPGRRHRDHSEGGARRHRVFFETPKGGAVFATGSIAWSGAAHAGYAPVQRASRAMC